MHGSMREKRPGVWELRVDLPTDPVTGRRRQKSVTYKGGKRAARQELAALVARHGGEISTDVTFGYAAEQWWELHSPGLAAKTAHEYRRLLDTRILPTFGHIPLKAVSTLDLERWYATIPGGSVRQVNVVVSMIFKRAVRWGWIDRPPRPELVRHRSPDTTVPTADEVKTLLRGAAQLDAGFGLLVRVAAVTGARRGELCGLQWHDHQPPVLHIRRAVADVAGHRHVKDTKTHQQRTLALDPTTSLLLNWWHLAATTRAARYGESIAPGSFVWSPHPDGSVPYDPQRISNQWRTLTTETEISVKLHSLRHANITLLLDGGTPVKTVQHRAGHQVTSTTLDTYARPVAESDHAAAALIGRLLDQGPDDR